MGNTQVYWLHTLSPTHVGTGRGVGYIDLPIHRDKVTNWPVIPGSAFKGVWADHFGATAENRRTDLKLGAAFGRASDQEAKASNAGALMPTDARLVCLPVRSYHGTFAWCTSSLALQMLQRDLSLAGIMDLPSVPRGSMRETILQTATSVLAKDGRIHLEDLDFPGEASETADAWAALLAGWIFPGDENREWRVRFAARFAVLNDEVFDFLTETGTEVVARVRIDDDLKTVKQGQLWNEETLPAETILVGLIACDRVYSGAEKGVTAEALMHEFATAPLTLQMGGRATIGRGRVRCIFTQANGGG